MALISNTASTAYLRSQTHRASSTGSWMRRGPQGSPPRRTMETRQGARMHTRMHRMHTQMAKVCLTLFRDTGSKSSCSSLVDDMFVRRVCWKLVRVLFSYVSWFLYVVLLCLSFCLCVFFVCCFLFPLLVITIMTTVFLVFLTVLSFICFCFFFLYLFFILPLPLPLPLPLLLLRCHATTCFGTLGAQGHQVNKAKQKQPSSVKNSSAVVASSRQKCNARGAASTSGHFTKFKRTPLKAALWGWKGSRAPNTLQSAKHPGAV